MTSSHQGPLHRRLAFLLGEPFTLPELQHVRKRMLGAGFLEEAGVVAGAFGRSAMGYRVRERERAAVFSRMFRSSE